MSVQTQINRINGQVSGQADLIAQLKGAINENVNKTSNEVSAQATLIAEIKTALEGKASVQLPELTNPGKASDMLSGKQLIDQNGAVVTGTIAAKTASNLSASGATVTVPAGYYASQATKNVATATQATPSISVSSGGLITASATQSAGYVSSGTKSATKQMTTQAAQTITPGTFDKTIASGRYLTGMQTIKGDANLKAENIAEGVSIFGITGTHSGGGSGGGSVETCTVNIVKTAIGATRVFYTALGDDGQMYPEGLTRAPREITVECVKGTALAIAWSGGSFSSVRDIICDGNAFVDYKCGNGSGDGCALINIPANVADTVNITVNCTMYMDT